MTKARASMKVRENPEGIIGSVFGFMEGLSKECEVALAFKKVVSDTNALTLIYDVVRMENSLVSYDGSYRVKFFLKFLLVSGGSDRDAMRGLWKVRDRIFSYVNRHGSTNFIGNEDVHYFYENVMPSLSMLVRLDLLSKLPVAAETVDRIELLYHEKNQPRNEHQKIIIEKNKVRS